MGCICRKDEEEREVGVEDVGEDIEEVKEGGNNAEVEEEADTWEEEEEAVRTAARH